MDDEFRLRCAEIRLRLHEVDRTIEQIQTGPLDLTDTDRKRAEDGMDRMGDLIAVSLKGVTAARAKVEAWVDHGRPSAEANVSDWKTDERFLDLNARADDVEAYASAVLELAAAAARECAHAVLEAVLARSDANRACLRPKVAALPPRDHPTNEGI
ncbi:MAG: hypothetical protein LWW93_06940 [Hyphomicrobiales bacterium]|nr:hypothetical protein [Hyphomicrobiales bacterium]